MCADRLGPLDLRVNGRQFADASACVHHSPKCFTHDAAASVVEAPRIRAHDSLFFSPKSKRRSCYALPITRAAPHGVRSDALRPSQLANSASRICSLPRCAPTTKRILCVYEKYAQFLDFLGKFGTAARNPSRSPSPRIRRNDEPYGAAAEPCPRQPPPPGFWSAELARTAFGGR